MARVVPVEIDLAELCTVDPAVRPRTRRLVSIRPQQQGLPSRPEARLKLPVWAAEHERRRPQAGASLQDRRETPVRVERHQCLLFGGADAPVTPGLVLGADGDSEPMER